MALEQIVIGDSFLAQTLLCVMYRLARAEAGARRAEAAARRAEAAATRAEADATRAETDAARAEARDFRCRLKPALSDAG